MERESQISDKKYMQTLKSEYLQKYSHYLAYKIVHFLELFHAIKLNHAAFYFEGSNCVIELVDARIFSLKMDDPREDVETIAERRIRNKLKTVEKGELGRYVSSPVKDKKNMSNMRREYRNDILQERLYQGMKSNISGHFKEMFNEVRNKKKSRIQLDECESVFRELMPELNVRLQDIVMDQHMDFVYAKKKAMYPDQVIPSLNPELSVKAAQKHLHHSSKNIEKNTESKDVNNPFEMRKHSMDNSRSSITSEESSSKYTRFKSLMKERRKMTRDLVKCMNPPSEKAFERFKLRNTLDSSTKPTRTRNKMALPVLGESGFNIRSSSMLLQDEDSLILNHIRAKTSSPNKRIRK